MKINKWKYILIGYILLIGSWYFLKMGKSYNFHFEINHHTINKNNLSEEQYNRYLTVFSKPFKAEIIDNTTILYCGLRKEVFYVIYAMMIFLTIYTVTQLRVKNHT